MSCRRRAAGLRTAGVLAVLLFGGVGLAWGQAEDPRPAQPVKMAPNSPDEPIRPTASLASAATFLDSVAVDWTRVRINVLRVAGLRAR